ncbi:MAG TPA: molybdopterin-synthase adenylyltransferase MoeB [Gemmatimonadota bacterium]|nr:molybdopterin-synthase adenylyltransferase MoeB [Gemmatimonadota bacterium]
MPKILIPTPLRPFANNQSRLEVGGSTVGQALDTLTREFPGLRRHLFDDEGRLRNFVNVYVGDENIRHLDRADTAVGAQEEISIVPSVAGGRNLGSEATGLLDRAGDGARSRVTVEELTNEEIRRYSRHLIMPEVTLAGQKKLKAASVLAIGAGGLGSPLALYLAAAGVGRIGIVDFDVVDESNLQRQILHGTSAVGRSKLESARERLEDLNPHIRIETHEARLTSENALELIAGYDVVADGTDNFPTRYLVNDACVLAGKPNVYASIFRFEGQASVFAAPGGPCYRCLYPEPPPPGLVPSCAEGGVLGILPGLLGTIQATETIKWILGIGEPLVGRLLLVDALGMSFRTLQLRKDPDCPVCGEHPSVTRLIDYEAFCGIGAAGEGGAAAGNGESPAGIEEMTVQELRAALDRGDDVTVLDVREPHEWQICRIEGASLLPLSELPARMHELDSSRTYYVHCKSGVRSAKAIGLLQEAGFARLRNVRGGIQAWAEEIDPSMPTY